MVKLIFKVALASMLSTALNVNEGYALSPFDLLLGDDKEKEENHKDLGDVLESDMFLLPTNEGESFATAQLVVLDKRLGKPSSPITLIVGKEVQYEGMNLTLQRCWQEKEEKWDKDSRALIKITDSEGLNNDSSLWVSSKFPGLSTLQNERFELLLQKCLATS